ncbi:MULTISPECIES: HAD family phosphatase [unclassified Nocardiopsis]|uniref:HAD family hydrolase n=1 Tax=unclassified Nocardiopsis TaxID=2649073 RepID=UPI00135AED3B|nr:MULTISPECIES: HAD family phosphatase [unclassified Nocardiopsis]
MNAPRVTAVWTDFGGVLTPPIAETMQKFCARMDIDAHALLTVIGEVTESFGTSDYMEPIDTPMVTEAEWLARIGALLRERYGVDRRITTLADDWFEDRETNLAWVEQLTALRARGVFVGMLSNMVPTWDGHWRRMVDPDALFDDVVMSFEVGARKPQARMFELAARRAGVPAERCVLVDDNEGNCEGARAAGWHAIHFRDTAGAAAELARLVGSPTEAVR